jgi:flagellin
MSSVIYTNTASLVAQKNLLGAQNALATSVERLSSGLRINRARDDAAGLSVANSLQMQINGANQGIRNMNDAISMVQTAEGAIAAASDMGQRILTLATQGANGTLGATEKMAIYSEMFKLIDAISSIGGRTTYSGNALLNITAQGTGTSPASSITAGELPNVSSYKTAFSMQISNASTDVIALTEDAFVNIGRSTGTGSTLKVGRAESLSDAINSLKSKLEAGTDLVVPLSSGGSGDTAALVESTSIRSAWNNKTIWSAIQSEASDYVKSLSTQRSQLGAYQNQMEYTLSNITELSANLSASKSRVIDTDYASETANLTRGQILQQAATAMLAQANQMPNVILTLLK